MKKFLLFCASSALLSIQAVASTTTSHVEANRGVALGLHGGLTVANGKVSGTSASGSIAGFTVGLALEAPLLPALVYFQPELNYVQRGGENSAFGSLASTRLNNLEVPLLAKVKLSLGAVRPYAVAGPRLSYLLSASTAGVDRTVSFNRIDLGGDVGAGVGFNVADATEVFFDARYSFGFVDIDSSPNEWKSQGIQLLAGLFF